MRTDSAVDDTLFVPDTQESDCNDAENKKNTQIVEGTQIASEQQGNISTILENFSSLEVIDNRFLKIEDHLIGLSSKSTTNSNSRKHGTCENFYTELLKKRISELEK